VQKENVQVRASDCYQGLVDGGTSVVSKAVQLLYKGTFKDLPNPTIKASSDL